MSPFGPLLYSHHCLFYFHVTQVHDVCVYIHAHTYLFWNLNSTYKRWESCSKSSVDSFLDSTISPTSPSCPAEDEEPVRALAPHCPGLPPVWKANKQGSHQGEDGRRKSSQFIHGDSSGLGEYRAIQKDTLLGEVTFNGGQLSQARNYPSQAQQLEWSRCESKQEGQWAS